MRWSIGFPRHAACQLTDSRSPSKGPAPGQRRPLVSGISRLAHSNSGNMAILAAMRRASSGVSTRVVPALGQRLPVV